MRNHWHQFKLPPIVLLAAGLTLSNADAETVGPLFEFEADTPAIAAEVNANFDALKTAVDDNAGDIDQLEGDVAGKQETVTGSCPAGSSIRSISATGGVTCETDDDSGGDITGVTVGTGLIGGGIAGSVSIEADTSVLQMRVGSSCAVNSSIRTINANGTVVCEPDSNSGGDITGVTAGNGLSGGGSAGNVTLNIPSGGVTGSEILNGSITDADISSVAGIAISKILGEAGIEFKETSLGDCCSSTLNTVVNMGSIQLTAPTSGFAVVIHTGRYHLAGTFGDVGIGTSSSIFSKAVRVGSNTTDFDFYTYSVIDIVPVSAGTTTFYALGMQVTSGAAFLLDPDLLAAVFIPSRY